jgi:hypothetical protein
MEIWPGLVMEMWALETEQLVTVAQRARSPEVAVARHLVSENRLVLGKLELDSRERVTTSAPAAWRLDRLARAFFSPTRVSSLPWRG